MVQEEKGKGIRILTYLIGGGGEVWGTLKLKYFLRITEKMEKVTSDGHLFSNLFRKFRVGFSV